MRAFPSEEMEGIIATLPAGNYTAVIITPRSFEIKTILPVSRS